MGFALSPMQLTSQSFDTGGEIAERYTKDSGNTSPQFAWNSVPDGAKSFAIFCHDPDAPLISPGRYGFVHWVLYNIPATTNALDEGESVGTEGVNDFGESGYGGPAPPPGHGYHHYFFSILALDEELDLEPGLSLWDLLDAVEPHVIGMNRLHGKYRR